MPAATDTAASPGLDRHNSFWLLGPNPLEKLGVWFSHRAVARALRRYAPARLLALGRGLVNCLRNCAPPHAGVAIQLELALPDLPELILVEASIEEAWPHLSLATPIGDNKRDLRPLLMRVGFNLSAARLCDRELRRNLCAIEQLPPP